VSRAALTSVVIERAVLIHLARRGDRLAGFTRTWAGLTSRPRLRIQIARDDRADPPSGCWASHTKALTGHDPLVVLEDDAILEPDLFGNLAARTLPADWDLLYLGGEHLATPRPVWPGLVEVVSCHRTHAYLVRDPAELAHRLGPPAGHLDVALDGLGLRRYAVTPWLATTSGARSDITP